MARIYKRGQSWYIDVRVKGQRFRKKVGTSKKIAELALSDAVVKIEREDVDGHVKRAVCWQERFQPSSRVTRKWLRGHFVALITAFYDTVEFDMSGLMGQLGNLDDPEKMQEMLSTGGESEGAIPPLLRGDSDPERLADVQALVAFIEGYGDWLVRRAGEDVLPDLDRIEAAYALRRSEPDQAEQFLQQMAGLELQRHRASDGAALCTEIARRWGEDALASVWEDPERLPTLTELTDPVGWAARVLLE